MTPGDFYAFTAEAPGRASQIITPIGVSEVFSQASVASDDSRIVHIDALWDTGASNSVITSALAKRIGLIPISKAHVVHGGGTSVQNVYLVNIFLPNQVFLRGVRVTECHDNVGNFGVIIGMDVITKGDFSLTNVGGKSCFSFRIPSIARIDYQEEMYAKKQLELNLPPVVKPPDKVPGRNDPCYCGSNKKYKHCHGR